jgi:hypothetical protein
MSDSDKSVTVTNSVGWLGLLGVVFVLLKVFGISQVAAWPWWLVLIPFWIGLAVFVGFLVFLLIGAGLVFFGAILIDAWNLRKARKRIPRRTP